MKTEKKGFTLIELLVVIAIIGLLSTLSIIALNSARARARDAKRISDVRQIQLALEMYYTENNDYPASIAPGSSIGPTGAPYLRSYPTPPSPADGTCTTTQNQTYVYTKQAVAEGSGGIGTSSYTVTFCLGAQVNEVAAGARVMTPAGIY